MYKIVRSRVKIIMSLMCSACYAVPSWKMLQKYIEANRKILHKNDFIEISM